VGGHRGCISKRLLCMLLAWNATKYWVQYTTCCEDWNSYFC